MDKQVYNAVSHRANGACEVCGRGGHLELHHILRRKVPATVDNCIMLCLECHKGTKGVHGRDGHKLDFELKFNLQCKYERQGLSEDEVRKLMGGKLY